MSERITFTMRLADPKKHSNRFDFDTWDANASSSTSDKFKPSFYVPKAYFDGAKRIRVTIEEV